MKRLPAPTARRLRFGAALGVALLVSPAGAAPVLFESNPWRSLAPHRDTRCVALGDLDGDGDLDLVFGAADGRLSVYLDNPGRLAGQAPAWTGSLAAAPLTGLALGDLDGDGDPDLVCCQAGGPPAVVRNRSGSFSLPAEFLGDDLPATGLVLADLDNDRDLDLVLACDGAPSRWFPNVDGVLRADLAVMLDAGTTCGAVAAGDLDQDGWLDLVLANHGALHRVIINRGGDLTTDSYTLTAFQLGTPTTASLGDIDGDGRLDIIVATSTNTIRTYLDNGDRTYTHFDQSSGPRAASGAELADLDGDGRLDLVYTTTATTMPLRWLRNTGGAWDAPAPLGDLPPGGMQAMALGDLDEDGDLDIIGATDGTAGEAVLWRRGGFLEADASWVEPAAGTTYGLAMVDLDHDGDLDVVQGLFPGPNAIRVNHDGSFEAAPDQLLAGGWLTTGLVVTDWDRDGDPDLLFSNDDPDQPVHLHLNQGGNVDPAPTPLGGPGTPAWSLAVADLDNDGLDDLITGGTGELRVALRDAAGVGFRENLRLGVADLSNWYNYLAVADVDGDGDRDLAAALASGPDVVFRNRFNAGATLDTLWISPFAHRTGFVSLQDLDGDAVADLTVGYAEASLDNEWFRGVGGAFDTPGRRWGASARATWQVELSDWDGDGYGDLLEAETDGPNRLLGNRAGYIDQSDIPLWAAPDSARTFRLAAGDLDQDGDLDLWVGNSGQPDQIFRGITNPGPSGPAAPAAPLLPGATAYLRRLRPVPGSGNQVLVACEVVDREADPVTIVARCRPADSPAWFAVETHRDLVGADGGAPYELTFDTATWPDSDSGYVLQLRSVESSRRLAGSRFAPRYEIRLPAVDIRRPHLEIARREITMPTLTVGGEASSMVTVSNRGNEALVITGAATSRPVDLTLELPASREIAPGASLDLELTLAPVDTVQHGFLVITTNDPRTPSDTLSVRTDIRSLDFAFHFLLEAGATEAPLGAALTGLLAPRDGVDMEAGRLHYRAAGADSWRTLELSPLDGDWLGVIPGAEVTEAGLEYYLEARNGRSTVTSPPGAPAAAPRFQAVAPPRRLGALVLPHSDAGILADRDVFIRLVPALGTVFTEGVVQFRRGGETVFQSAPVQADSTARIPAAMVGARGLEFHIEAHTASAQLREPPTGEQMIRVQVAALAEPQAADARRYRMVSVPLDFGEFTGTIGDLVSDQGEFGPYDVTRWRCLRYLPESAAYGELSTPGLGPAFRPEPGRAFWLIAAEANRLDTAPVAGRSLPTGAAWPVDLAPGWNQVGNPFAFPVEWSAVAVVDGEGAPADTLATALLAGDGGVIAVLPPFGGGWIRNLAATPLQLRFTPREAPPQGSAAPKLGRSWQLRIVADDVDAETGQARDAAVVVGVQAGARVQWDPADAPAPPPTPGRVLGIDIANPAWTRFAGPYVRDIRPPLVETAGTGTVAGHGWDLMVGQAASARPAPRDAALRVEGLDALPGGLRAVLVDRQLRRHVDVTPGMRYPLVVRGSAADVETGRFRLEVGTVDYLAAVLDDAADAAPAVTVLLPVSPNPFNPATVLRYELAEAGSVRLCVYDLRGRRVRELVAATRPAGRYEALWDGRDERGQGVGAGVYVARLDAPGGLVRTMKMTLVD